MSDVVPSSQHRFQLKQVAFFGRTLAEYLKMFSLDREALRGLKILDVASGPGSFVAEALAMGLDATGCDPMYAQDVDTIARRARRTSMPAVSRSGGTPGFWSTETSMLFTGINTSPWKSLRWTFGRDAAKAGTLLELCRACPSPTALSTSSCRRTF